MGFFDSSLSTLLHGTDRRKDDAAWKREERAALALKLKAKLRELQACGVNVDVDDDDLADTASPKPVAQSATRPVA